MKIMTPSGHEVLADDADAELLSQFSWYIVKNGYGRLYAQAHHKQVGGVNKRIKMHRLLMDPPKYAVVHHKNNDGLDNRRGNLEITTHRQNSRYASTWHDRHGVHLHKQTGKWRAQTRDQNGERVSLGMYATKDEATDAVLKFRETAAR